MKPGIVTLEYDVIFGVRVVVIEAPPVTTFRPLNEKRKRNPAVTRRLRRRGVR